MAISAQTGSNWFLIILQTGKLSPKKESCFYGFQDWKVENLFSLGFDNGCLDKGHTEATMCVKWWLKKFNLQILKSVTCLSFSNIDKFYQDWNFGCFCWKCLLNINLIYCTYQNLSMTFTMFLVFKDLKQVKLIIVKVCCD